MTLREDTKPRGRVLGKEELNIAHYETLFRSLHANPELSLQESETAKTIGHYLRLFKEVEVREHIGGHGIVGIFRNGPGPIVLLRADMDALPLKEETGLDYQSTKRMIDTPDGIEKPVMHACGHDLHCISLLAALQRLYEMRSSWGGTLVALFQPNEERGAGAQAMVDDGLYDPKKHAIPIPEIVLGGHVTRARAGMITTQGGPFNSAADSFKVTLFGRGGHGSRPHLTVDPVVLASSIVMKLQTIVSRETDPHDTVVVTVGALQAGSTENIISDVAIMKVNIRTFSADSRIRVINSVKRMINAECEAFDCPKPAQIVPTSSFPLLYNDEIVASKIAKQFKTHFGDNFIPYTQPSLGSEDFGNLATSVSAPCCYWNYGAIDAMKWDAAEKRGTLTEDIAGPHSPSFEVAIQPTLTVAIEAFVQATLAFTAKDEMIVN